MCLGAVRLQLVSNIYDLKPRFEKISLLSMRMTFFFFLFLRSDCAFSMVIPYTYSNMRACRLREWVCAVKSANHATSRHWTSRQPPRARIPKTM